MKHHCKWVIENRSRSSLAMRRKEEKKALVSSHTHLSKDYGKTNVCIFTNMLGVRV
jgi:hypothetical protein